MQIATELHIHLIGELLAEEQELAESLGIKIHKKSQDYGSGKRKSRVELEKEEMEIEKLMARIDGNELALMKSDETYTEEYLNDLFREEIKNYRTELENYVALNLEWSSGATPSDMRVDARRVLRLPANWMAYPVEIRAQILLDWINNNYPDNASAGRLGSDSFSGKASDASHQPEIEVSKLEA
ncbi:hypothetical protein ABW19_dt0202678 [Dactylella cylindrospora]|nr:hypothetical protein ABW19_dt0202678 [Dactylella cylindrospora]